MCGTVSFRPTYGLIGKKGCFFAQLVIRSCRANARTVKDAAIMLEAMKGFDANDPSSVNRTDSVLFESLPDLKGVRLGFYEPYMFARIDGVSKR